MNDLKNLKGAKELNKTAQRTIKGGGKIPGPTNCKCFCYANNQQYLHSCFTLCPGGSIPGLISGGPECTPADPAA